MVVISTGLSAYNSVKGMVRCCKNTPKFKKIVLLIEMHYKRKGGSVSTSQSLGWGGGRLPHTAS